MPLHAVSGFGHIVASRSMRGLWEALIEVCNQGFHPLQIMSNFSSGNQESGKSSIDPAHIPFREVEYRSSRALWSVRISRGFSYLHIPEEVQEVLHDTGNTLHIFRSVASAFPSLQSYTQVPFFARGMQNPCKINIDETDFASSYRRSPDGGM